MGPRGVRLFVSEVPLYSAVWSPFPHVGKRVLAKRSRWGLEGADGSCLLSRSTPSCSLRGARAAGKMLLILPAQNWLNVARPGLSDTMYAPISLRKSPHNRQLDI